MSDNLKECPFCGENLVVTKGGLAVHSIQSLGNCFLSGVGFPIDACKQVAAWDTRSQPTVTVDPLVWVLYCPDDQPYWRSEGGITQSLPGGVWKRDVGAKIYDSVDDAKAAAQADHDARILSQLTTTPATDVRTEALREAASLFACNPRVEDHEGESIKRRILALIDHPRPR